jgi:hypothetical protein
MRSPPRHGAGYNGLGCTSSIRRRRGGEVNTGGHDYDNAVRWAGDYDRGAGRGERAPLSAGAGYNHMFTSRLTVLGMGLQLGEETPLAPLRRAAFLFAPWMRQRVTERRPRSRPATCSSR